MCDSDALGPNQLVETHRGLEGAPSQRGTKLKYVEWAREVFVYVYPRTLFECHHRAAVPLRRQGTAQLDEGTLCPASRPVERVNKEKHMMTRVTLHFGAWYSSAPLSGVRGGQVRGSGDSVVQGATHKMTLRLAGQTELVKRKSVAPVPPNTEAHIADQGENGWR